MSEINHDYQQPILDTATGLTCTQSESTRTPNDSSPVRDEVEEGVNRKVTNIGPIGYSFKPCSCAIPHNGVCATEDAVVALANELFIEPQQPQFDAIHKFAAHIRTQERERARKLLDGTSVETQSTDEGREASCERSSRSE